MVLRMSVENGGMISADENVHKYITLKTLQCLDVRISIARLAKR